MNLPTVRKILKIGTGAIFLATLAMIYFQSAIWSVVLFVVTAAAFVLFEFKFWRCPLCGKRIGNYNSTRCKHCGTTIE